MAIKFEASNDTEIDPPYLQVGGTFLFMITHADENPVIRFGPKKNQFFPGFAVRGEVLTGEHKGKTHYFEIRNPDLSHKDKGEFCKKVQTRFFEATAFTDKTKRGVETLIELARDGKGRMFIATLEAKPGENGKVFPELDGGKIWHVDDPNADKCGEISASMLALLPKELRRAPEYFAEDKPAGGNGHANGNGNGHSAPPPANKPGNVNLDDL